MAEEKKRSYGKGIFEKYEGVWYARWTDAAGNRHVQKAGAKAAAIHLYRRRKNEVLQGKRFPENMARDVKFADIAADALKQAVRAGRLPGNLAIIKDWFPNRNAADITVQDVARELDRLQERGLTSATRNRYKSAISAVFTLAARNGRFPADRQNQGRLVPQEKETNERVRFLSEDEEARSRAAIRERWPGREPELDLALFTGMRKSEQYGLRWESVDLIHNVLTIARAKGNKTRYVRLNASATSALAALRKLDDGSGQVCPGGMGKDGYGATRFWFDRALAAAGINDFHWHDLRHTFASRLRMRGVELADIKDLLGHTTLNMVLRYAHLAPDRLRKAVEVLDQPCEPEGKGKPAPAEKVTVQ